jgi:hypothetical protein
MVQRRCRPCKVMVGRRHNGGTRGGSLEVLQCFYEVSTFSPLSDPGRQVQRREQRRGGQFRIAFPDPRIPYFFVCVRELPRRCK